MIDGDSNTAYFHGIIKARRNKNYIHQIRDHNGNLFEDRQEIQGAFLDYYQMLLGSRSSTNGVRKAIVQRGKVCSDIHSQMFLSPISHEEIKEVMFHIPNDKAPGPDGQILKQLNATLITLIPKVERPATVLEYRPIACCNVIYKCISKLLCNRLDVGCSQVPRYLQELDNAMTYFCSMMTLLKTFSSFSRASGLKMSKGKSNAYFNGVAEGLKNDILKMVHRIRTLGARKLSYAGRLILVRAVLKTFHNYWAQMFILPTGIITRIEVICRNFLWDGGVDFMRSPLVAWDKACKLKTEGGLGLKNDVLWNRAAVDKLVLWIAMKSDLLWVKESFQVAIQQNLWGLNPAQRFTIAKAYDFLRVKGDEVQWHSLVWNKWTILKHSFLVWIYHHGNMNTKDKLFKLNISEDDTCCICGMSSESIDHLFFDCHYSKSIIFQVGDWMDIRLPIRGVLRWRLEKIGTRIQKDIINATLNACVYHIWRQRNLSRHDLTLLHPQKLALQIIADIRLRMKGMDNSRLQANDQQWIQSLLQS
ncbi:uncharacterized protein LOC141641195 [Silene latifolia]|uniref:uncharacterized protein LOC141641195 n=1 Tax=Silene latifolia TaxID=37657 RepID=UPI003D776570